MIREYFTQLIVGLAVVSVLASVCLAGIGQEYVTYHLAYPGPEVVTLMVVPDGSGPDFTEARIPFLGTVDATITVDILDVSHSPIVGYPSEDIWLASEDEGMVACAGGAIADGPTDANGQTTFSRPPKAGGWSLALLNVVVNGSVPYTQPGVRLNINSPDFNGDLKVNLSDVIEFAGDFYGSYHFRSDLYQDQILNLSDLILLSQSMGAVCP